jgi:transposase-like protein
MITPEMRAEMRRLVLVERWRIETVARRFGVHHSTVRRALADHLATDAKAPESALDPHKPFIVERLTDHPALTAVRLFAEI